MESFLANSRRLIETAAPGDSIQPLAEATVGMRAAVEGNRESMLGFQQATQTNRSLNMSQAVNGACDELIDVVSRLVEIADNVLAYCDWVAEIAAGQALS